MFQNHSLLLFARFSAVFGVLILFAMSIHAQRLEYNVIKGGKVIGKMVSDRQETGDKVTFKISSQTKFKMLFSFSVTYASEEVFVNDALVSGYAESVLNGVTQKKAKVWKQGRGYESELDGTIYTIDVEDIGYTVSKIYHEEPNGYKKIYSQNFAGYLSVEESGDHKYILSSDDGKNIYSYKNGICTHVKVSRVYATFYFELIEGV